MIEIRVADITTLSVEAVVNAANHSLLGGGGVDGAIHRAAGPELRAFNATLGGCPTGEARISPGFRLAARWVISTVGPVWHGGGRDEAALLASCYHASFTLAAEHHVTSIAFPAISTGVYGFPKLAAERIALDQMRQHEARFDRIVACCFSEGDAETYRRSLASGC